MESQIKPKTKRGGYRANSGRKPKLIVEQNMIIAAKALSSIDEIAFWQRHLNSSNERISLDAGKYLTDRRDGKAKETHEVTATHTLTLSDGDKRAAQEIIARLRG